MVRRIVTDPRLLSRRAENAGVEDLETARDLLDTLAARRRDCVGLAANMIGVNRRVIVFEDGGEDTVMFNPEIIRQSGPYQAEEECLSFSGARKAQRWRTIQVRYENELFQSRTATFTGRTAQIIQHEIDHCEGILI